MSPTHSSAPAIAAVRYRHQCEQRHLRRNRPGIWAMGKLASLAGGTGAAFTLHHAANAGEHRLLLAVATLLAGIAILAALRTWDTSLTLDAARLMLPLPLDPASRWRSATLDAAIATGLPALALVIATALMAGWQWAMLAMLWLPAAWSLGTGFACALAWSLAGGFVRWRPLAAMTVMLAALGGMVHLFTIAVHPLPPLMVLPDALILGGLALGPGAAYIGRAMIPVAQQVATAPPRAFAAAPRLIARIAQWLNQQPTPAFAIASKDLIAHSRDAFVLLRLVPVAGVVPISILLHRRFGLGSADAGHIATIAVALAVYGLIELRPSPFGSEGNRLLLALHSPISVRDLFAGKVLGALAIELPQVWAAVTIAAVGLGTPPTTWALAILASGIAIPGLCVILTAASVRDIDLERRVDDRTQAILAEHVPFGVWRMLGLGLTGTIAAASGAILVFLPMPTALGALAILHGGLGWGTTCLAIRRLTALRAGRHHPAQ